MRLLTFALLSLLVGCSETTNEDAPAPAPATGTVRIANVTVDANEKEVIVHVRVENGTNAPVYTFIDSRKTLYKAETAVLDVVLAEEKWTNTGSSADCHYFQPRQKQLGALRAETIDVKLPGVLQQGTSTNPPATVELPIHKAKEVNVSLAWGEVPLEPDPGVTSKCRVEISENVVAKQKGIATGAWRSP